MNRCKWAMNVNEIYTKYHDEEWGEPVHDDQKLYEMLILESFQAGLSWSCILNKRENFRKAFDNFDIDKIINYALPILLVFYPLLITVLFLTLSKIQVSKYLYIK